jgi:NO-binding membrane sensor protein with MHYT domain
VYEHKSEPLLPFRRFLRRQINHILVGLGIIGVSLGLGVAGYHFLGQLAWIDALVNASMILGGMGPVDALQTTAGKIFASLYALYSRRPRSCTGSSIAFI